MVAAQKRQTWISWVILVHTLMVPDYLQMLKVNLVSFEYHIINTHYSTHADT